MKTKSHSVFSARLGALLGLMMVGSVSAQTVDFLLISKQQTYTQTEYNETDGGTAVLTANPWRFRASVEGTDIGSIADIDKPTMIVPVGSTGLTGLGYDSGDDSYVRESSYSSKALLDAAYLNGNYSLTAFGQTVSPILLDGDSFPAAPVATLSAGEISGGVLVWDVSQALTLTISGSGIDHMGLFVFGSGYNQGLENFGVTTVQLTINASSLIAGQSYTVEMGFDDIVGGTAPTLFAAGTGAMSGAEYAAVYGTQTKFTIQAIPEPSTYAALVGGAGLAVAVWVRRRRR